MEAHLHKINRCNLNSIVVSHFCKQTLGASQMEWQVLHFSYSMTHLGNVSKEYFSMKNSNNVDNEKYLSYEGRREKESCS